MLLTEGNCDNHSTIQPKGRILHQRAMQAQHLIASRKTLVCKVAGHLNIN